ncbi:MULTISPECIES: LysR family transcriptional regulator [Burkholderia]|uniref:LysR family transcriptional regulator n=2 Tax=Burkholderia multivorans TaxID=87883 RepID=A0A8E2S256_9BURK|nr:MULTISPECIES: LysR family transcriptional regulator [Burkholderia]AJY19353.1 bacterial regulatory helix-turn-helix, lysR family protein [Burkholderia multivorans ATCC BAA-247]AVR22014.1 LysR family transcriptional regulator [Burkholderia multivorans]EEE07908.1 transcriptional regulator, LysR family [Burkholderia multivorans CGD2]EEE14154.1 transcriptional regulator, LysR family [Burkholderia multivorans CGD2M]EJO51034.1 LysR substrate binding domain protein [Burkholderia multivorans ATCC BA
MSTPTLKQLDAFYWAATCANFATAAQRLHLSVSSLSKRINELEQVLGRTLFDRSGYRATLTQDGESLLPTALRVLESVATIQDTFGQHNGLSGRLRFGVGELSAMTWLPRFVAAVQKLHGQLQLEPHVDVGEALEEKVDAGELDFAVVAGRSSRSSIVSQPVAEARFAWMAAERLVGRQRTLTPALLARHALVTLPAGSGVTRILDEWLLARGIDSPRHITCNNWFAVAGMLREGVGIGFLPTAWEASRAGGTLVRLTSQPALSPLHYAFQWRRGDLRATIPAMLALVRLHVAFDVPLA